MRTRSLPLALIAMAAPVWTQTLGLFDGHNDIGTLTTPGTAAYDPAKFVYSVSSGGENMWAASDDLHFVWKKISAVDVALGADIAFATTTGNNHKKGVLIIRQSLDADSAYCDAALHLDGLTSLQCRERKGGPTFEIQQAIVGAKRLRLEKRGAKFHVFAANAEGRPLRFTGGSISVAMEGEFYIGLGVCAHDKSAFEQVEFSNVSIGSPTGNQAEMTTLEVAPVRGDRRALHVEQGELANPKWFADGKSIAFWVLPQKMHMEIELARGAVAKHSDAGFSDAAVRVFAAKRRGKMHLYTESDGRKTWLTEGKNNNTDPRLTAGNAVVFTSDRSGTYQLWRLSLEPGTTLDPLTNDDDFANAKPFVSPDGLRVAFVSTPKAKGEPSIRVMTFADKKIVSLAKCNLSFGSWQTSPWSPDSRSVVFVTHD